ncbi:hypothetical protein KC319_g2064, partial [Hortaea werneckii]
MGFASPNLSPPPAPRTRPAMNVPSTASGIAIPGILTGIASATIHMQHPYPAFFWLLMLFFLLGTAVTRI